MNKIFLALVIGSWSLLTTAGPASSAGGATKAIVWRPSLEAALRESKRTHKPVLVDFWATWCDPCRAMDKRTYMDPAVVRESRKWVCVKVDIDAQPKIAERYGLTTPPMVAFLRSDGAVIHKFIGYNNAAGMVKLMKLAYWKLHRRYRGI